MGTTALRRLGYVVGLVVLALVTDRLSPYARGWVDGVRLVVSLCFCVAVWRSYLATRRRDAVEVSGRKARWLAKHPDSVVGRV